MSAITLLGAFPPPLGGAAKNNQLLYEDLLRLGCDVTRIDVSGGALAHNSGYRTRLRRFGTVLVAALRLTARRGEVLYLVPDGGNGIWYTLALLVVAQRRFRRVVLHHRTFRYIDRPHRAVRAILRFTRGRATHVFLSPGMAESFQAAYGTVPYVVSSNARYVATAAGQAASAPSPGVTLGHLSNLCADKGYYEVEQTFAELARHRPDVQLLLAGPVVEPAVAERIEALRASFPTQVQYFGPLVGTDKDRFYRLLDVFLFPTNFAQEAAPNVIYEAFAAGVPVITKRRGCISEMVPPGCGIVVEPSADFPRVAASWIAGMSFGGPKRESTATHIRQWLGREINKSVAQYGVLLDILGARRR